METICVIGLGYIGLPTASLLATKGYQVHGVDINPNIIETINRGEVHIQEPDLDILVKSAVHSGNLRAFAEPVPSDIFIIAVPTPFKDDHSPDISYIESATRSLAPLLRAGNLVILESTSPVGTTERIGRWLQEWRLDLRIASADPLEPHFPKEEMVFLAHCPERVLPGQILKELVENDRIIGGINRASAEKAKVFYEKLTQGHIVLSNARTAELAKLTENAYRDVNIAFANELSLVCDQLNINVWELIDLANHHPRVNILQPGPGVGGHCIAVDPWFIVASAPKQTRLIRTARQVNDEKPHFVIQKIKSEAARLTHPVIACLGLSFKADIDDLRESPAVHIVESLAKERVGKLLIVEPHLSKLPQNLTALGPMQLTDATTAISQANLVVLLVNHRIFRDLPSQFLEGKVLVDTRGMWR